MATPAAIIDVDGTLVDVSGIRHYVTGERGHKNTEKFHQASAFAPPMPMVIETVTALRAMGIASVVLTARTERWRYLTRRWCQKYNVAVDAMGMRGEGDRRIDSLVKYDLYKQMRGLGFEPVIAFDDRPSVVELWQSLSIPTVVVPGWFGEDAPSLDLSRPVHPSTPEGQSR